MAALYCSRCKRFHDSAQPCRRRRKFSSGPITLPGAVFQGLALGLMFGFPFGALTQHPAPFIGTVAIVTVGRVGWYLWRERG